MFGIPAMLDFSTITATSVLGWYAWHTTYHTIPGLVRAFREELQAMRCAFGEERELLYAEIAAERRQRHEHQCWS
jgi:hypothetical protein